MPAPGTMPTTTTVPPSHLIDAPTGDPGPKKGFAIPADGSS